MGGRVPRAYGQVADGGHAAAANHSQQAEMNALTYVYLAQKLGLGPAAQ